MHARSRSRQRHSNPCAFTVIELMIVVAVVAVLAAVVLPAFSDDSHARLAGASAILTSDIEAAQAMTISNGEMPVVVRFDASKGTWWLAYSKNPETPIVNSTTGQPMQTTLGVGRAALAQGVTLTLANVTGSTLRFNPQGGMSDFTVQPQLTLGSSTQQVKLTISPTTGTITETFCAASSAGSKTSKGGK
jgi:prepilin-type N-terminal cleavage/methylation domain-containing protein